MICVLPISSPDLRRFGEPHPHLEALPHGVLGEPRADLGRAAPKPLFALGPAREDYHRPMLLLRTPDSGQTLMGPLSAASKPILATNDSSLKNRRGLHKMNISLQRS